MKALGVPAGVYVYADIEAGWEPSVAWLDGWVSTLTPPSTAPALYGNPDADFGPAYDEAYAGAPAALRAHPDLVERARALRRQRVRASRRRRRSRPRRPGEQPAAAPCVWQYVEYVHRRRRRLRPRHRQATMWRLADDGRLGPKAERYGAVDQPDADDRRDDPRAQLAAQAGQVGREGRDRRAAARSRRRWRRRCAPARRRRSRAPARGSARCRCRRRRRATGRLKADPARDGARSGDRVDAAADASVAPSARATLSMRSLPNSSPPLIR